MKYTRISALAALGVAATLSLTACGSDGSETDASAKSSAASSSSHADGGAKSSSHDSQANTPTSHSGGDVESRAASPHDAAKSDNASEQSTSEVPDCETENLAITARDAATDADSGRVHVSMINRGSTTCSATGFPGADINDMDNTRHPIKRASAQPRVTTLHPGDVAAFELVYDIDTEGESLNDPTTLLVTPPNETHSVTVKWPKDAGEIAGSYGDVEVYPTHTTK